MKSLGRPRVMFTAPLLVCAELLAAPLARAEAPAEPAPSPVAPPASASPTTAPAPDAPPSTTRTVGFVLAGLGFVGIGIGGFFAIRAASEAGSAAADPLLCTAGVCTEAGRSTIAELRTQRTLATLLVGGGMIGLAGGAILLSLDDEPSQPAPRLAIGAALGDDGAGLRVGLTF